MRRRLRRLWHAIVGCSLQPTKFDGIWMSYRCEHCGKQWFYDSCFGFLEE